MIVFIFVVAQVLATAAGMFLLPGASSQCDGMVRASAAV